MGVKMKAFLTIVFITFFLGSAFSSANIHTLLEANAALIIHNQILAEQDPRIAHLATFSLKELGEIRTGRI